MQKRMTELNQNLLDEISLLIKNKKGKIIYIDGNIQLQNGKYLFEIMLNSIINLWFRQAKVRHLLTVKAFQMKTLKKF